MRGHIEQRGDRWRATVDLGRDPVTGHRIRRSVTRATRRDAEDAAADLIHRARRERPTTRAVTVGQLLERWYDHVADDLSPNTRQGYRSKLDTYLIPTLGQLPLDKLTAEHIDKLYRQMRRTGGTRGWKLSPSTVRRTHANLNSALKQAVKWGLLGTNPADQATVPAQRRPEIDGPALDDVRRILTESGPDLTDAAELSLATGARAGELCGIRWPDLDTDTRILTIRRAIADTTIEGITVLTQHRKSKIRKLRVPPVTLALVARRRANAIAAARSTGVPFAAHGYVLSETAGTAEPLSPERITGRWRDAAERARIVGIRFHDLRHWNISALIAEGHDPAVVAQRAGHSSKMTTLDVYAHAAREADERAADTLERLLR